MPHITTDDGVRLYYEETGSGTPIAFVHEFADECTLECQLFFGGEVTQDAIPFARNLHWHLIRHDGGRRSRPRGC